MKNIIVLMSLIFFISCREDNSNNILIDQDKHGVEFISFKKSISRQNVDRFISDSQIDGLNCSNIEVSESQNKVEIDLEFTLENSEKFIYDNLNLSVNIGVHSVSVPFQESSAHGDAVKSAVVKLSLEKSDNLVNDSRPYISITGSVAENLGNGTSGKSSSLFNVWDLLNSQGVK